MKLTITYDDITNNETGLEETVMADRTITEENDPVEVVGLAEGAEFTVLARALEGTGTVTIIGPNTVATPSITVTVNDGGDDSGITFPPSEINPATFDVPTAADSNVTGTLTLRGKVTGEDFTLNVSSNVELAATNVMTTLTFSDGRNPIPSTVTRAITINIVLDELDPVLPDNKNIMANSSATSVTLTLTPPMTELVLKMLLRIREMWII